MTLGEKIKFYRNSRGMTQKYLGALTEIHEVSIRKYEADKIVPKREQLEKIASALGYSLNEFLDIEMNHDCDAFPLLFAIDEKFEITITSDDNVTFKMEFENPYLNHFLKDWQSIKELVEIGKVSQEDYEIWKKMRSGFIKQLPKNT